MAKRLNGHLVRPLFVIIAGILGLLILFFLPLIWMKRSNKMQAGAVFSRKNVKDITSGKRGDGDTVPVPKEIKRDPFLPPYMRLEGKPSGIFSPEELGFSLSGIVWDPENPVAIINGEVMHTGDVIDGKKILEIKKNKVIFGEGDARYTVTLWEE